MPESPELAVSRDRLRQILTGRNILSLHPGPGGRYVKAPPDGYSLLLRKLGEEPARIEEIHTKGKFMWWSLSFPGDKDLWYMFCTYGMSGGWEMNRSKHTGFSVCATDHINLFFNDPRHFGTIKFVRGRALLDKKLKTLGPCILNDDVSTETFKSAQMKKPSLPIGEALMNQAAISGIGNYLRAEILYQSKISPHRLVSQITDPEWEVLTRWSRDISALSYRSQGATLHTYKTLDGDTGSAQFMFQVYGKEADPSGRPVLRETDGGGRTIHWCPEVQK